jgi:hypothetical protein
MSPGTETEDMLRAAFQEYGQIENMRVPGKNFGFVQFANHGQVQIGFCASAFVLSNVHWWQAANAIAARNGSTPRGFSRPLRCTWASERRTPVGALPGAPTPALPAPATAPPPVGYGYAPYPAPYPPTYLPPPGAPPSGYPGYPGPGFPAHGYPPQYMPQSYPPGGPHGYPPPSSYPPSGQGPPRHDGEGYNGDRKSDHRRDERDSGAPGTFEEGGKYGKSDKDSRSPGARNHPYAR